MNRVYGALTVVLAVGLFPVIAWSQDLKPLSEVMSGDYEKSYPIVRCAAFYTAMVEWAGQKIGEPAYDTSKSLVESLLIVSSLVRAEGSPDELDHISNIVMIDARAVADLYLTNFRESYAATGNAWAVNPVWNSDIQTCEPIAQAAIAAIENLGGN